MSRILKKVSIPFKRETISKGVNPRRGDKFQKVSIPFKRETISKGLYSKGLESASPCFNSLQTGTHIQRR